MASKLSAKQSSYSLVANTQNMNLNSSATAQHARSSFRPCSNCTCSPGLLSRQNRRTSVFLRQFSRRNSSGRSSPKRSNSSDSIYSSDSLCATKNVNTTERLKSLRIKMKEHDIAAYIVPSEDEHQSEYVSSADQRRSFISGFTGSAGIAIITRDLLNFNDDPEGKSALSTDGRYFTQASQELDYNWTLLKQGANNEPTWQEWVVNDCIEQSLGTGHKYPIKIGIDPRVMKYQDVLNFKSIIDRKILEAGLISTKIKIELTPVPNNLVDEIWPDFEEIPIRPSNDLIYLNHDYSGEEFSSKFERLNEFIKKNYNSSSMLLSALDEIAWLFNLRGSDILYNPVFFAYAIIHNSKITLFTNNKFSDGISNYFKTEGIIVKPYNEIWNELSLTTSSIKDKKSDENNENNETKGNEEGLFLIPDNASWEIVRNLNNCKFKQIHSPIDLFKSVKNEIEILNMKKAQLKDAISIIKFFSWLENELINEGGLIDEYSAGEKLIEFRQEQEGYIGNSFESISSTGSNASIIHYSPIKDNCAMIDPSKIYLADVGSQFFDGTTDITRTVHFTNPEVEEINNYTLVLKGNLAIERLTFPEGTNGYMIDSLARQFLWSKGLDYRHGTGHGVGSFLNVHEGPIGISTRVSLTNFPLKSGNIITNEPGYYEEGKYGIRIENDLLVEENYQLGKFGDQKFLKFRNLTLVPYCKKLINPSLLSQEEISVINNYHKEIFKKVSPHLKKHSLEYNWLKRETAPL